MTEGCLTSRKSHRIFLKVDVENADLNLARIDRNLNFQSEDNMRALTLIIIVLVSLPIFAADSLNIRLEASISLGELRGLDVHSGRIFAFAKSPKLYSIEYVIGGGLFLADSLVFSGFTMPWHTHLAGRWIHCAANKAYLADWTSGFHIVDISNPFALSLDTTIANATTSRSVFARGDSLYVSANANGMRLYDISSEASFVSVLSVGSAVMDAIGYPDGTVLVAESGVDFSTWNLASASAPISWLNLPGEAVRISVRDYLAFIAAWGNGIHIVDISDLSSLSNVATINFWDDDVFDIEPWGDNRLLVAAGTSGFSVVNLGTGAAIWEDGYYRPSGAKIIGVASIGNLAFAADISGRVFCFDLSAISPVSENAHPLPDLFTLSAHPNPFNSAVTIAVEGVGDGSPVPFDVEIYDVNGRMVEGGTVGAYCIRPFDGSTRLTPTTQEYIWSPHESLPSGVYLVRARVDSRSLSRAEATGATATKRIVYLK